MNPSRFWFRDRSTPDWNKAVLWNRHHWSDPIFSRSFKAQIFFLSFVGKVLNLQIGELTGIYFWIWSPRFPGKRRERVWIHRLIRTRASMENLLLIGQENHDVASPPPNKKKKVRSSSSVFSWFCFVERSRFFTIHSSFSLLF